jgi:hypothetical protein
MMCNIFAQRIIEGYSRRQGKGWDSNGMIKSRRDFENPSLHDRLVVMFGKFSSASIPDAYLPSYFYDSLGK